MVKIQNMKKLKILAIGAILFALSSTANAQDESFGTFFASYNPLGVYDNGYLALYPMDGPGEVKKQCSSFTAGVTYANILSHETPFFIEYGLAGQYSFWNKNDDLRSLRMVSLKIPFSLMYAFDLDPLTLIPYAGVDGVGYVWGQTAYGNVRTDMFKKIEDGGSGFNRFGINWHAGAKVFIGDFLVGVAFEGAISPLYKTAMDENITTRQVNVALGFRF